MMSKDTYGLKLFYQYADINLHFIVARRAQRFVAPRREILSPTKWFSNSRYCAPRYIYACVVYHWSSTPSPLL